MRIAAVFACLAALCTAPGATGAGGVTDDGDARLVRALDAVRPDYIRADLRFIASDELQGRDTPSPGLRQAARFIRARLQRLGFQPGGHDGGFFHLYRMGRTQLAEDGVGAELSKGDGGTRSLVFGEDYYFYPNAVADLDVEGEVVFVGDGSAAAVEGLDLSGRWGLAFESEEVGWRERGANVRGAGAVGLVVASPLGGEDRHGARRAGAIAGWVRRGSMHVIVPQEDREEGEDSEEVWPQVFVAADVAREMLGGGEVPEPGHGAGVRLRDRCAVASDGEPIELENVAGFWPGSDPELSREVIIVSAHYDHVGVDGDQIYNGADDNGSGTCGMLAIAEALAAYGPMQRSVLLLWVSGEEKGLHGSYAWTKDPTLPPGDRPVCALNIDMIGRNAPDYLLITPSAEHPAHNFLAKMAEEHAPEEGFPELGSCDDYWRRSDHVNFSEQLGIPVAFLFSDVHEDYHQPTDTADKIDYDKVSRVSRLVVRMLDDLQNETL